MRHNQKLDYDQLRDEAAAAVEKHADSQAAVARELGVTRSAINRAVKEAGPMLSELQKRIIAHLTPYEIEESTFFQAKRKDG